MPAPSTTNCVDVIFQCNGSSIPRDHGYSLYGAISRIVPTMHQSKAVGIFPIRGSSAGDGTLLLNDRSTLRVRLPANQLPALLPLAGKTLELDGHRLRLGVPHVAALIPAAVLASSFVLIKLAHADAAGQITPDAFLAAAKKKLEELNVQATPALQLIQSGGRAGQVRRKIMRVKDQTHVGFAMVVQGLTADESILLQEQGMGGRRVMGCGLFLPLRTS